MKKILVTGGNGFIGSHVVDNLVDNGYKVTVFDHLGTPSHRDGVITFLGDVNNFTSVSEAIAISDGVIHLAGVLGTAETINEPKPAIETNLLGSLNVFQACKHYGKRCSYITVGNYWMNNSYSISKTTAERFAWMFNKEHNTEIAVVRALNAFGERQKQAPVRKIIPNFVIPALQDGEITIYGDGSQIMDMIYVKDLADIMVRSLVIDHNQYKYSPIREGDNLLKFEAGTGRRTTVLEIAETVIQLVGKGKLKFVPMRPGEPESSIVLGDPTTLIPLYGNVPSLTTLEDGLVKTIDWYKTAYGY